MNRNFAFPLLCALVATANSTCLAQPQSKVQNDARAVRAGKPNLSGELLSQPLAIEQAVAYGIGRNPQTRAAKAGVDSALATYKSIAAFPSVQLSVTHAQGTSTAPTLNGAESDTFFDIGEVIDTSGQKRYQAAGARAQYVSARYQLDELTLSLDQQIRDAYWSLAAAQQITRYSMESLQEAQKVNSLVRTQNDAGAAPKIDLIRSGIDVANAQQAYLTAQAAEQTALSALNVLLVRPPLSPLKLADDIETGMTGNDLLSKLTDLQSLTNAALANRPLIKSATEQFKLADYTVRQTRATRFPDLSIDFERSVQQASDTVMFSIHMPILDFGNLHHSIKAAEDLRRQAAIQKEQAEQQVAQQAAQAFIDAKSAQSMLDSYMKDIFKPSITLREMAQLGYTQGATGILPVIDAESTLRAARTGYINSLLAARKAQDELKAAIGGRATR